MNQLIIHLSVFRLSIQQTIGTLLSLIDGKVFSGGNDLKLLHFRPNYFMCQYQVTSKGLALVVLLELRGHAPPPPPPDFGKQWTLSQPGEGDYAQHITNAPRFFRPAYGPTRCLAWDPCLKSVKRVKVSPCHFSLSSNFISRIWPGRALLAWGPSLYYVSKRTGWVGLENGLFC